LAGGSSSGSGDVFVCKYDDSGNELWTRQFSTSSGAFATGISVDGSGVYLTGYAYGALPGQSSAGGLDAYVRKYDGSGAELWTRQLGTSSDDNATGISVDGSSVYVTGYTTGTFPGQTRVWSSDASVDVFVAKLDAGPTDIGLSNGNVPENQPLGTTVGELSTADARTSNPYSYALVAGDGDADNASFNIAGNVLQTNAEFDFETRSSFSVRVRSTSQVGLSVEKVLSIGVTDVEEIAGIAGPADGVPGQTRVFTLSTNGFSLADQAAGFTYSIDWNGDDTPDETVTGPAVTEVSHAFTDIGTYTVKVTATDKDGEVSQAGSHTIQITTVKMQGDNLAVGGTSGDDSMVFLPGAGAGTVEVTLKGASLGTFTVAGQILAFGLAGTDSFTVGKATDPLSTTGAAGLTIDGQQGADTYTVYLGQVVSAVTVRDSGANPADKDTLRVYGTEQDDVIFKAPGHIAWGVPVQGVAIEETPVKETVDYAGIEPKFISGRGGDDWFIDPADDETTLLGGPGDDTFIVNAASGGGVVLDGEGGSDTFIVACGALQGPVEVTDTGNDAQEVNRLTIQGVSGDNASNAFTVAADQVSWGTQTAEVIHYTTGIDSLAVDTAAGTNSVQIDSTSAAGVTVNAQGGTNTYVVAMGSLAGTVALNASGGTSDVTINAPSETNTLTLSATGLTGAGETIQLNLGSSTLASLTVSGSEGNTQLVVEGTPPAPLTLDNVIVGSTTTVSSSANPSILNGLVTFTAVVSPAIPAAGTPTGEVQFQVDGANLGSPVLLSGGSASITTSAVPVGTHTVAAFYSGAPLFVQSSGDVMQNVHYAFSGFLPPLSQNLAFALGRTIPIKFQLADANGHAMTALSAVASLQVAPVNADGSIGTPFNPLPAGNTSLRNDGGQYVFNWQTKGLGAGSYAILLALKDGSQSKMKLIQLSTQGGSARLTADSPGAGTSSATAGALLGGDVALLVDNQGGQFGADELVQVQDAIAQINSVVGAYGVTIYQVDAAYAASANVVVHTSATSVVGGYADGVLGCTTDLGDITLIQGWSWYTGADTGQIAADQYDFETIVTHELGHALGLGHSDVSMSVMYATLSSGATSRAVTTQDLNVADTDGGPSALRVAVPPRIAINAVMASIWNASWPTTDGTDGTGGGPGGCFRSPIEDLTRLNSSRDQWDARVARACDPFFQSLASEENGSTFVDDLFAGPRYGKHETQPIGSLSRLLAKPGGHKQLTEEAEAGFLDEELLEILALTS
jgi:hypothetical protein